MFSEQRRGWRAAVPPVAAALFGLATFALSVGLGIVNPTEIAWLLHGGDQEIHFLGWHLFRRGPWSNPVGAVPLLTWPIGTSVGLTDSIPLAAVLAKPFSPLLSPYFQYFGLWLLGCFTLQGVFGALLMRTITSRPILQIPGACLFVMSPAMIVRPGHAALTGHWLLLWALWLYFRSRGDVGFWGWLAVSAATAATHPYLAFMVCAVMSAAHVRAIVANPSAWRRTASRLAIIVGCVAFVIWQAGYFVVGTADLQGARFGEYSMNLLSPIMPMARYETGTGILKPALAGQYEGYAYLGAGVMLLMPITLVALMRPLPHQRLREVCARHWPLALALTVLLLLAIGPVITLGPWTLFEYDAEWWGVLTLFRANGRMIWPVYYTILLGILAASVRVRPRPALIVLSLGVVLQAWDASSTYRVLRQMRTPGATQLLQSPFWDVAPRHYRRFVLFPTGMCTTVEVVNPRPFALIAGRDGLAINAGAAARADTPRLQQYCSNLERDVRAGIVDPDALYILRRDLVAEFRARATLPAICATIDAHGVCVAEHTYARWQGEFDIMFALFPSLEELVTLSAALEEEYRDRLRRPERTFYLPVEERVMQLARYLWYRNGGCDHELSARRVLGEEPEALRICGDPFRGDNLPSIQDTADFRARLEDASRSRAPEKVAASHVDLEGEAVWIHRYIRERLGGRDAFGARVEVINSIRRITGS